MSTFDTYSKYYDLLYQDKDYQGEAEYIEDLIRNAAPGANSLLNLGCGTGMHDFLLADSGFDTMGVDLSESMIEVALQKLKERSELTGQVRFMHHDIRTLRLRETFDVVTSLFHVISYQTTNDDLDKAFQTAREHLTEGGVFIFDCWHGPAVLSERPELRVKRMSGSNLNVLRIAEPVLDEELHTVDVNYEVVLYSDDKTNFDTFKETHKMRYLFSPEIEELAEKQGFKISASFDWMTLDPIKDDSWSAVYVLRNE